MDEQATLVVGLCGVHAERLRIPLNGSIPTSLLLAVCHECAACWHAYTLLR
jgi:hypothetical protein